jgi:hypothetical protein
MYTSDILFDMVTSSLMVLHMFYVWFSESFFFPDFSEMQINTEDIRCMGW